MSRRATLSIVLFALALLVAAAIRLAASPPVGDTGALSLPADWFEWSLRARRVLCGALVGGALAGAGVMLQALLRNPLAEPGLLGLTGGAGLGVMVAIYIGYAATGAVTLAAPPIHAAAIGAIASLAVVYALGQRRGLLEPLSLILVGVVVSAVCGAAIVFLQYLLPAHGWAAAAQWSMGALSDDVPTWLVWVAGAVSLLGVAAGAWLGPALDAAALADDEARSVGAPLSTIRLVLFALSGVLTACAFVLAGPIAFVGLICPHVVRLVAGPSHRALMIGAALAGAALVIGADALVRIIDLGAGRMPIGVLTALLGGPAFIWLLRRRGPLP